MNNVLEYIYNHLKETKRIIGITDFFVKIKKLLARYPYIVWGYK